MMIIIMVDGDYVDGDYFDVEYLDDDYDYYG
jgi:hypothetical protein